MPAPPQTDPAAPVRPGGADCPTADVWTRALWLAETTASAGPNAPVTWRKRTAALRLILEAEGAGGNGRAAPFLGELRVDYALHGLADAFGTLPAAADHLPATILMSVTSRLIEAHGSRDAALGAMLALCRANAVDTDPELTDAQIRRGHVERRAAINRAARLGRKAP